MSDDFLRRRSTASSHLDWNNQWIAHQVCVNSPVKHVDCSIIASRGKERVRAVEGDTPQSVRVIPQRLVWLVREIQVEPCKAFVLRPDNHVVSTWVDGHASDSTAAAQELLRERLFGEVVDPDMVLGRDKEEGLGRVEGHALDAPAVLLERILGLAL